MDFQSKLVGIHKANNFVVIKRMINHRDITIINIYVSNTGTPYFIKDTLLALKL